MNKLIWKSEEEMQKELEEHIKNWKEGYSRDGYVEKARGVFEYKGIKYLIIVIRYFNHTNRFVPMGDRISDCHVCVEYPEETEDIVNIVSGIEGVYDFLYHDTNHSFNDNQTLEEQIKLSHKWAKEDIDSLFNGEIANKLNESISKIQDVKNKLEKLKEESKKAEENKVFIERAEPLTIEGIRAMSLSDED
ncbi:MAG: hypothetical protein WC781_05600, partial [Candidatus Pacearchaeota archaeon]